VYALAAMGSAGGDELGGDGLCGDGLGGDGSAVYGLGRHYQGS